METWRLFLPLFLLKYASEDYPTVPAVYFDKFEHWEGIIACGVEKSKHRKLKGPLPCGRPFDPDPNGRTRGPSGFEKIYVRNNRGLAVYCTRQIGIGEGLTTFALPHHRAYGSVPGGSHSLP
jgi:hypothetical protein